MVDLVGVVRSRLWTRCFCFGAWLPVVVLTVLQMSVMMFKRSLCFGKFMSSLRRMSSLSK